MAFILAYMMGSILTIAYCGISKLLAAVLKVCRLEQVREDSRNQYSVYTSVWGRGNSINHKIVQMCP